jgi:hypothetical protein
MCTTIFLYVFALLLLESTLQNSKSFDPSEYSSPSPGGKTDDAALQESDRLYWITTLPSGERIARRQSDDTEVSVPKANVCIMSDPQTSQVTEDPVARILQLLIHKQSLVFIMI